MIFALRYLRSGSRWIEFVMAGLVPAIHAFLRGACCKTWMPGTSPGMTPRELRLFQFAFDTVARGTSRKGLLAYGSGSLGICRMRSETMLR